MSGEQFVLVALAFFALGIVVMVAAEFRHPKNRANKRSRLSR